MIKIPALQVAFARVAMDAFGIRGLTYIDKYLTTQQETELIATVDAQLWMNSMKRRVQHYGYLYDYKRRTVDPSMYLGALPEWAAQLALKLKDDGFTDEIPDQLIVNEYLPGQGIASHIDCEPCFGEIIISITLASGCAMNFTEVKSKRHIPIYLERGSLVVMQGEARHDWKHGILPRKSDQVDGKIISRGRRISLTFRNIVLPEE
jgi:alkylated DNA repair dioxygenase AlkB